MNGGTGGVEILIFQFAHLGSVHCVGPVGTKFLHVEEVCASTNLLIGVEGDADASVRNLMVFHQIGHGFHNLCDAGLVIGAEECVAVGDDEVFAHMVQHLREHLGRGDDAFGGIEDDVTAVVVLNDAGVYVGTRAVGAGVVVRNEPYGGHLGGDVGGQCGIDIALLIHGHVLQSHFFQGICQMACEDELFRCTRAPLPLFRGLGVVGNIVEESLY